MVRASEVGAGADEIPSCWSDASATRICISSHVRYASDRYRNGEALKPMRRATYGLMRSSENYMRDWQQDGIVFVHAHMSGASCCQRLIRPAIAAPRTGASQNSQSCAM